MATLRALRLLQSIESKNINSTQLETLLAGNASRQTDLPLLFAQRAAAARIVAPETFPTVLGSAAAAGGLGDSTLAMNVIAASVSAMGMVAANTTANAVIAAKDSAGRAVTANKSVYLATIGQSGAAIQGPWAKQWRFPRQAGASTIAEASTAVRSSDGLMMSIGQANRYAYSSNGGATWTVSASGGPAFSFGKLSHLPNANNTFMAVLNGSTATSFSTGGSFTAGGSMPSAQHWSKIVAKSSSSYLAISLNGNSNVAATTTATSTAWTGQTLPSSANWADLAASTANYVVVGGTGNSCLVSSTGTTGNWSAVTLPFAQSWTSVDAGAGLDNGKFMALGGAANGAFSSNHGATWTAVSLPAGHNWARVVYHAASRAWVAFSSNTAFVATSVDDGATWSLQAVPLATLGNTQAHNCNAGGPYVLAAISNHDFYVNV